MMSLQRYQNKERSANKLIKALKKGVYDTDKIKFIQVDKITAQIIAQGGGLSFATFKSIPGRRGHIATLTGELIIMPNGPAIEINQAGASTGIMDLYSGFKGVKPKKIKFYSAVYK